MGVKDPIAISVKSGDLKDVFCQIVRAAELPHLSIPETENRKIRKQYKKVISQTLVCVSGI
jgi:mitochondrial Rho GTPase 1